MCGIVGLFLKNKSLEPELGALTALMLHEMGERGPDSAGFAIYGDKVKGSKVTMLSENSVVDWQGLAHDVEQKLECKIQVKTINNHAVFTMDDPLVDVRNWIIQNAKNVTVLSTGQSIELYKGIGNPDQIMLDFALKNRRGTHAIGHTRMATESAVTTAGSHPFSTGADTCLVHNGSLSNHNQLREMLKYHGETFQTENDSEVAAGYLAWRIRQGDDLKQAIEKGFEDLDGFYTFAIGTHDGFAIARDPIACKPAVIAETDDWVAMSSEFRAIAKLPDVKHAKIWEPEPATVYAWSH